MLVEGYDALAIAISSALKKFAPAHSVRVARSIAEAETLAAEMNPELFLLDLDPPPVGDVEFLVKLQTRFPEARALVIASGASRELRAERGTSGAVQFIEKPFELGDFGAAVQALLGRWSTPPSATFRGTLRNLHVIDVVQLKCLALSTAVVRLETPGGQMGEIHFHRGEVCHATTGQGTGVAAFEEIVRWPGGRMMETELPADAPVTIDQPWAVLLLDAVRKATEQKPADPPRSNDPPASPAPSKPKSKTILVIDDTEMLLIFAADVLGTADASLKILTATSGHEGLEVAAKAQPNLILLDYSLAETTGAEVCRELLQNEATARIPVLMMSGHLPELANTAATYRNVVATLPKPFLSSALIDAVEEILAHGPLPKPPDVPPPASSPATDAPGSSPSVFAPEPPPTPAAPELDAPSAPVLPPSPSSSPNGFGNGPVAQSASNFEAAGPPAAVETLPPPPRFYVAPDRGASVSKDVRVTFSFQILAMKLTPDLRLESLRLAPADFVVGLRVDEGNEIEKLLETGFRMGRMQLTAAEKIGTILLIPTQGAPGMPPAGRTFTVSGARAQSVDERGAVDLNAAASGWMQVYLTARFEFVTIGLSPTFGIAAVALRARDEPAKIWSKPGDVTAAFALGKAQLDETGRLRELFVRAIR